PILVDTPRVQALIATNASQALGRPVKFRSMSISVLPLPAVALHGLEIAEDPQFGKEPFLKLETGKVRLKLLPLLTGRVELGDVQLTKPVITVIQTADGRMNISTLGTGAGPKEPKAGERPARGGGGTGGGGGALPAAISIEHGLVAYVTHGKGGGTSQYRVEDLNLTPNGGGVPVAGPRGAPGVAGDFGLAKPTVSQLQPSCPEPKRRTLTLGTLKLNAAYRDQVLSARPLTTSLGDGTITGQLSLSLAPGMQVQLTDLAIKALPLEKALVDYLCQGYAITGPMDLTGATSFSAQDVYHTLSGPGALKIGRGKVVGPRALALLGGSIRVGGPVHSLLGSRAANLSA